MKLSHNHIVLYIFCFIFHYGICAQATFTDITEQSGIDHYFQVFEGTFGGGAVAFDLNNDGFEDLYLTSGTKEDALYLNNGDGTFKNIYNGSGVDATKNYVTQGVVSADVNRDGWRDLFVTTINTTDSTNVIPRAKNLLFLNNGDMTFRDATSEYKLDQFNSFSTGPSFGDINADGYPDLYIGNYFLEFEGTLGVLKDATIVSAHQTAKGYLLLNKEGEYFENVYEDYDLDHSGFGFGALFTDFDNDGDQDLLVNHDFGYKAVPNFLYENRYPKKSFQDLSEIYAMDLKENAMGSAVGDYNNDGLLDYYVTNIKFNLLMENQGVGQPFVDRAKELGVSIFMISWGANFADFDHDGDLDLYVSNGDLNPNCTPMGNFYFENDNAMFTEKGRVTGTNDYGVGRGSIVFDIENDGDLDLLVVNQKPVQDYPTTSVTKLFRNDIPHGNWLKVALKGEKAETNGIGSRVEVVTGKTKMMREIDGGGSSHLSQNTVVAHFGLGKAQKVDSVIVTWVGGKKQILLNQKINQLLTITEIADEKQSYWYAILPAILFILLIGFYSRKKSHSGKMIRKE